MSDKTLVGGSCQSEVTEKETNKSAPFSPAGTPTLDKLKQEYETRCEDE